MNFIDKPVENLSLRQYLRRTMNIQVIYSTSAEVPAGIPRLGTSAWEMLTLLIKPFANETSVQKAR